MRKNKSVLWGWTLSYIFLLTIPLISIFSNYYTNEKAIRKEYINSYELTVCNLRDNIDSLMARAEKFYYYIITNDSFGIMKLSARKDSNYYNNSYHLHNALIFYRSTDDILNCAIYNTGLNHISSPQRSISEYEYYINLPISTAQTSDYEDWKSFMTAKYNDVYLISNYLSNDTSPCLIYANTLSRGVTYPINIFVTIPLAEIEDRTKYLPDNTYLILQTKDNQLHTFCNTGILASSDIVSLDTNNNLILQDDYLSVSSDSAESNLTCHLVITKSAISDALYNTRKNFVLNLVVTLLLGFAGIIFLVRRNYRPVSDLLRKFNVNAAKSNEFLSIATTYEKLQKEYRSARLTVQSQKQKLLNSQLLSLIKGRISESDIQNTDFHIATGSHIALIGFMIPFSDQQSMEYDDLLFFAVDNIFRELFIDRTCYHIEDGRFIYYLFDLKDGSHEDWHDFALEKLDYLCDFFHTRWNIPVIGVVSETTEDVNNCKFLYRKIMEAFEFQNISGGSAATDTRSLTTIETFDYIRDFIEQELNTAIMKGDLPAALGVSEHIFSSHHNVPFTTQKIYAFDAFTVIMSLIDNYITDETKQIDTLNYVSLLVQASNVTELKTHFDEILAFICTEISQKQQSDGKKIVLSIREYIIEHYTDQNLSVSSMADALERNPKYISRVFKEDTGIGILDYINNFRIAKAKEIMQKRKYTLEEVSEMVGYANVRAFRRAFVKITGDIPSKFYN